METYLGGKIVVENDEWPSRSLATGENPVSICQQAQCNISWVLEKVCWWVDWFTMDGYRTLAKCAVLHSIEDVPVGPVCMLILASVLHRPRYFEAMKVCGQPGNQWDVQELRSWLWFSMCINSTEPWFITSGTAG